MSRRYHQSWRTYGFAVAALFAAGTALAGGHRADGTFAGNQVFELLGEASPLTSGDYVSNNSGLDTFHRLFIEVTPGATQLATQIFDADIHAGGNSSENSTGLDASPAFGTNGTATATYSLRNPSGTQVWSTTITENTNSAYNNAWVNLAPTQINPAAGHWEFRVDMNSSGDTNAFGFRAYETSPTGTGDREFNVYYEIGSYGKTSNSTTTRSFRDYPYITSGCDCRLASFDFDLNFSTSVTSRSGNFTDTQTSGTGNGNWYNDLITGWNGITEASDYGIWQWDLTLGNSGSTAFLEPNWSNSYFGNASLATPPSANPPPNVFRTYLPTDGGVAPVKPFVRQELTIVSGSNPPTAGLLSRVSLHVDVVNPTNRPIVFSNAQGRTVTAFLPPELVVPVVGPPRNYHVGSSATQGTIISQPATGGFSGGGGSGTVVWDPGTVAAGASVRLYVTFDTLPFIPGETVLGSGTVSSNGTRAIYLDETGVVGADSRGVYTFGSLCQVQYVANTTPLFVTLDWFRADAAEIGSPVTLRWKTSLEESNAGFHIWRSINGGAGERLTQALIPGLGDSLEGAEYVYEDGDPLAGGEARTYWLVDYDFDGTETWHGPVTVGGNNSLESQVRDWTSY